MRKLFISVIFFFLYVISAQAIQVTVKIHGSGGAEGGSGGVKVCPNPGGVCATITVDIKMAKGGPLFPIPPVLLIDKKVTVTILPGADSENNIGKPITYPATIKEVTGNIGPIIYEEQLMLE